MKLLLAAILFILPSVAFAVDFECTNQVSKDRTEFARISTWPRLDVSIGYSECKNGSDGSSACSGGMESIADDYSVCYSLINVKADCFKVEGTTPDDNEVVVSCNNGVALNFDVDPSGKGTIFCSENGKLNKSWFVGSCVKK